ncbi:hypothetical protein NN3_18310 [Nocardia neocaledoniensis NBRC 108232]|nr:hypothetical protein NN3_18310 [Nocardia neocaledoniensis NBRC 108232]
MSQNSAHLERIAVAIEKAGFRVEPIADFHADTVALRIPAVMSAHVAERTTRAAELRGSHDLIDLVHSPDVSAVLPYGTRSGFVYPYVVCHVLDLIARAEMADDSVAASDLATLEGGRTIGLGDADPHTDYPANLYDPDPSEIHGLNVHLTLRGSAAARFSSIRSYAQVQEIAGVLTEARRGGRTHAEINDMFSEVYADQMSVASVPVPHRAGDVLVFQARPHHSRGLLPVVHHFESRTEDRWHTVFSPRTGSVTAVTEQRRVIADHLHLHYLGYHGRAMS